MPPVAARLPENVAAPPHELLAHELGLQRLAVVAAQEAESIRLRCARLGVTSTAALNFLSDPCIGAPHRHFDHENREELTEMRGKCEALHRECEGLRYVILLHDTTRSPLVLNCISLAHRAILPPRPPGDDDAAHAARRFCLAGDSLER